MLACGADEPASAPSTPVDLGGRGGATAAAALGGSGVGGRAGAGGRATAGAAGSAAPGGGGRASSEPLDPTSPQGQAACAAKEKAYDDFLEAHSACSVDADCDVVGDCGPNADFRAVAASDAREAYDLARARCDTAYDGPVFDPRCKQGRCALEERTDTCCGCPPADAGL